IYVLAAQILGPRPLQLEARTPADRSFGDLEADLDALSHALVELENGTTAGNAGPLFDKLLAVKQIDGVEHPGDGFVFNFPPPEPIDGFTTQLAQLGQPGFETDLMLANIALPTDDSEPTTGLYFCIPPNETLLRYWDTVEDRLFKIRNCLDIEGLRLE